jgi:glycine oxidase
MKVDTLIVGQGLAGSLLAWELISRGRRVLVVDRDEPVTSSKVAAGIVTPITGQRLAPTWRLDEFWRYAIAAYRRIEIETGEWLFRPLPIARLLAGAKEKDRWSNRIDQHGGKLPPGAVPLRIDETVFRAGDGGFEMPGAGWLDVPRFLATTRRRLLEHAAYAIGQLSADEVEVGPEEIRWKGVHAGQIVFCQGWEGNRNRFFDWVPFRNAKGQILDLVCPGAAGEDRIINRAGWLLPLGGGRFRAGATYEWDFAPENATLTTVAGCLEVEAKLAGMLRVPWTVTGTSAAVRPVIRESRAVIGMHPAPELWNRVGFFNGLGSKGVLNGPFFARQLAAHLVEGAPIEDEVDLKRNF